MSQVAEPPPGGQQQRPLQLSAVLTSVTLGAEVEDGQAPAPEAASAPGNQDEVPFELLLDENPDVDYIADIPEDAACLISQPDGSVVVGIDVSKVPADPASRTRRQRRRQRAAEAHVQAESRAAFHALRAQQAVFYRRTVVRPRRFVYMGLVGADMLFFLVCLLVQAFTSGLHMGRKWSSVGVNGVNLYWWPTPKTLTLEEVAFSLVVDLVGVMAGFQEKPPVLGLFLLLDLITTILIGIHGISLFLLFRGVQMAVCILYRNALVHCMGMCMTEVERLEFLSTELGIMTILHTMAGFCGVLCGIEPQQAQRASRDGQEAAASPSLREGSAAPPPEQIMATPSTMSRTASIAGTAAEPGTEPEGGTAETDGAQPQPSSSPTLMLLAPTAGQALERQHQPSVLGADVPIPARGALAPAGTVSGAEPLTTVAVFSFAAGAAHASVQRSDTASSRQPDVSANATAAGPADWCVLHAPRAAAHAAGAVLGAAGGAAGQAAHTAAGTFDSLLSGAAAPGASQADAPTAAVAAGWSGSSGVGSGMHTMGVGIVGGAGAAMGYHGQGAAASAIVAWSQQPQPASLWPHSQALQRQGGTCSASTFHNGLVDAHDAGPVAAVAAAALGDGNSTHPAAPAGSHILGASASGRGWMPVAAAAAGGAHGEASAATESGLGRSPRSTPQSQDRGVQLQALQLQLQLTQMSLRLQQRRQLQPEHATQAQAAAMQQTTVTAMSQLPRPSCSCRDGESASGDARPVTRARRTGVVGALLSAFAPSQAPIKPRRLQTAAVTSSTPGRASGMDLSALARGTARRDVAVAVREAASSLATQPRNVPPQQPAAAIEGTATVSPQPAPNSRQQQQQQQQQEERRSPLPHPSWQLLHSFVYTGPGGMSGAAVGPWPSGIAGSGTLAHQDTLSWRPDQHNSLEVQQPPPPQQQQQQQQLFQYVSNQSNSILSHQHGRIAHDAGHEAFGSGMRTAAGVQQHSPFNVQLSLTATAAPDLRSISLTSNGVAEGADPRSLGLAASSLSAPNPASVMSLPVPAEAALGEAPGAPGALEVDALRRLPAVAQQRKMLTAVEAALAEAQRLRRALEDRRKMAINAAGFTTAALSPPGSRHTVEWEPLTGVAAAARAAAVPFSRSVKRREHSQSRPDLLASDADAVRTAGAGTASPLSTELISAADETRASGHLAGGLDVMGTEPAALRDEGDEPQARAAPTASISPANGRPFRSVTFGEPCPSAQMVAAVSTPRVQQQAPSPLQEPKAVSHAVRPRVAAGLDEWAAGRGLGFVEEQGHQARGAHELKPAMVQRLGPGRPGRQPVGEYDRGGGAEQSGQLYDISPRRR